MGVFKVSTKDQVVIPQKVRKKFALQPGQKFRVISYNERIELIPEKPLKETGGFIKGIDVTEKGSRIACEFSRFFRLAGILC